MPTPETIEEAVRRHARERADVPAFTDPARTLTWAQLDDAADRCAALLAGHAVGQGDRVAWLGPNSVGYPVCVLGAWRRGASIVGLNFRLPPADLAAVTEAIGLDHVVVDARFVNMAAHLHTAGLTVVEAADDEWPPPAEPPEPVVPHDDDEALIYFTSGSTGHPKAVPLTRRAVEATIPYADVHGFGTDSRALVIPPNFHAAGATWANYGMHIGMSTVYTADTSPAGIVDALIDQAITHTLLVPTLLHAVVEELKHQPRQITSLKHVGYGASPITQHLLGEAMDLLGCEFGQVYGLTETGGGVSFLWPADHLGDHPAHLASAGRPGKDVEVEVRGPDRTVLPTGQSGELWFRAPSLTRGYLGNPEATSRVLVDGWLNTRDVGFLDEDGYIYVQGRSDDMIQTGGENVHPQAVEEVLITMPGIAECAVFGVPDPHWGQRVTAAVVADPDDTGDRLTAEAIRSWCTVRLARYQVPKSIVMLHELPRTASGKVKRTALAANSSCYSTASTAG